MGRVASPFPLYVVDATKSCMLQCGCWMQCGEVNVLLQLQIVGRCGKNACWQQEGNKEGVTVRCSRKNGDGRA